MRRTILAFLLISLLLVAGCTSTPQTTPTTSTTRTTTPATSPVKGTAKADDFEAATENGIPAGWSVVSGNWSVVTNQSAPKGSKVLLSDQTQLGETLILNDAAGEWSDFEASVKFNVLAGEKGQAGGIVFRHEDDKNYYVVRYNHNELSWNLFRTVDGNREKFPGTDESAEAFHGVLNRWFDLRVEARGSHIQVISGGVKVIDYTEEASNAPQAGKVGLWTRYDSKTQFDDFAIRAD